MRPSRHATSLLLMILGLAFAAGCADRAARTPIGRGPGPTPRGPITLDRGTPPPPTGGRVPGGSGATPISLETDFFTFTGPAVPGTASLTNAIVWDPFTSEHPPFGAGGVGTANVMVDGTRYAITDADAFVARFTDDAGVEYLVITAMSEMDDGRGGWWQSNVAVFVLASDFAPHATVALDGTDRVAIFAAGPDGPEPTIFAAAVTGTVTFGAGSAVTGERMAVDLAADFAPAESIPPPGTPPDGVPLVAGNYDLVIEATPEVFCGDSMAGHEASFAAETLAPLGSTDGPVVLALPTTDSLSISGAALGAAWGDPLLLDALANPPDTYLGAIDLAGVGPDGTELAGAYMLVEGLPESAALSHAAIGLAYVTAADDGGCDVVFHAELRARP